MSPLRLAERLLQLIPVLLGISVIVFAMMALTPGDPVQIMLGDSLADQAQRDSLRRDMGLDLPVVERFFRFLGNALTGNFGLSFFHRRPVMDVILERLPATIELTLVAMFIAIAVAVPLGVIAAVRRNSLLDRIATIGSMLGVSMPGFWFGILLILLFAVNLHLLPVSGRIGFGHEVKMVTGFVLIDTLMAGRLDSFLDALRHMLLPAVTLGLAMSALLMRVTRTSMLEALSQDYVTFAEAKGLSRVRVVGRHALKNALIPTVTVAAIETGSLLGGNMIIETVFGWPGLGRLVVEAIFSRNYPLVQAAVLIYATTYVLLNFLADLLYTVLNPKVRL
ncbi:MAG: ABC transporter permease [Rhodospirillaceae bacterium]|nr:ABC transporter permease [Rhodospirillaceae bacterium]